MNNTQNYYLPCRLCKSNACVLELVNGGDHQHFQVCCNQCGIEVCRLSEKDCRKVWNDLMRTNVVEDE